MIRRAVTVFAMILFAAVPSAQATEIPFGPAEELASGLVGGVGGVPVMAQGDLDGDGDADIAVAIAASASNGGVWWFENLGIDGFAAEQLIAGCAEGGFLCRANDIQLVDMDSDGDLDLLGANFVSVSDTIGWYPNDGLGNFGAPTLVRVSGGARLEHVTAADFDGDGDLDVAAVNRSPAAIAWYTNNGGGTFNTGTENAIDTLSVNSSNVIHADVDGDGDVDLVACNGFADVVWFENTDGAGTFSTKQTTATPPEGIDRVRVGDIDGDGDIDALSSYSVGGRDLNWHEN
ncbi:MAG: VCBS repeat-containing protein, partial [Actinomycetia bacterium]|nr:VCBS repeat-containing protein [Actinomycetes bacterium]